MSKQIADLLFPNVKDCEYYISNKVKRNLPEGAFVTRCAPSPTGYVHIGTYMQALLDTQLAKRTGGVSILRIEDTDSRRKVSDAVDVLLETLTTFNINFDEGVLSSGEVGSCKPYYQSERSEIYQSFAKYLVEKNLAYPCFCTMEDDAKIRLDQEKELGKNCLTGYYGKYRKCADLTFEQIKTNLNAGKTFAIRFKSQSNNLEDKIEGYDVSRGKLSMQRWFKDEIILKSDKIAVYHFAHIVDDFMMGVNLVIRGSEWLSTFPLHIDLYNALNLPMPKYLHTLLLCKVEDGNRVKLSKRKHPECQMSFYKKDGILPKAVNEYLFNLFDSSFENWRKNNPSAKIEDFELKIENFPTSEAMLDLVKILDIDKNIIATLTAEELYEKTLEWAKSYDVEFADYLTKNKNYAIKFMAIDRGGDKPRKDIAMLSEISSYYSYFIKRPTVDFSLVSLNQTIIEKILNDYIKIYNENDDKDSWWNKIKLEGERQGFATDNKAYKANPELFKGNLATYATVLRLAVTGQVNSPDLCSIMQVLGKNEVVARLSI